MGHRGTVSRNSSTTPFLHPDTCSLQLPTMARFGCGRSRFVQGGLDLETTALLSPLVSGTPATACRWATRPVGTTAAISPPFQSQAAGPWSYDGISPPDAPHHSPRATASSGVAWTGANVSSLEWRIGEEQGSGCRDTEMGTGVQEGGPLPSRCGREICDLLWFPGRRWRLIWGRRFLGGAVWRSAGGEDGHWIRRGPLAWLGAVGTGKVGLAWGGPI
jgi:hypothetical protein